jgi:hypothetical protein
MAWQLLVIDGADKGRFFPLPDQGTATIGSSRRSVDICLHDLYVTRVHCEIVVAGERVVVRPADPRHPILLNGEQIVEHQLQRGEVFKIGNSQLRLDPLGAGRDTNEYTALAADKEDTGTAEQDDRTEESEAVGAKAPPTPRPRSGPATPPPGSQLPLPALPPERLPELSGYQLGHYEIGKVLGTSATGVVFRARDLKTGLVVALRIISPEFPANEAEMQPFIKTLRLVLPLRHRNLVSMWNAGRTIPYCWLAVDYVEGENLAAVLQQLNPPGKFAWQYALHVGLHVARALNYVHRQKLAHGNVTPANIFIRQADKIVKLGDLMLFKALEGSVLGRFVRNQTLKADLPYHAPEQAIPNPRVDSLTDIYSLGACLFARCTGQTVVQGRTIEEIVEQIHHGPMVRPRQFQASIPGAFDDAVGKMLARRREDRYQSAADVVADLESIAEAEGVEV